MPGVCALGQGAWVDIDEETGIDLAGCVNVLHGGFHCWSCGERGSAARYARDKYGLSWPEAYRYVEEHG